MSTRTSTLRRVSKKTAVVATAAQNREQQIVDHLPLVKYLAQRIATRLPASVEVNDLISDLNGITIVGFETIADNQDDGGNGMTDMLNYLPDTPERNPQFIFERGEIREHLTAAIERLPGKERLVISLYYHDELTMKEI